MSNIEKKIELLEILDRNRLVGIKTLSSKELDVAFDDPYALVAGHVDIITYTAMFLDSNLKRVPIPLNCIPICHIPPDFNKLELTECGRIIKFGDYQITSEFVLNEARNLWK